MACERMTPINLLSFISYKIDHKRLGIMINKAITSFGKCKCAQQNIMVTMSIALILSYKLFARAMVIP